MGVWDLFKKKDGQSGLDMPVPPPLPPLERPFLAEPKEQESPKMMPGMPPRPMPVPRPMALQRSEHAPIAPRIEVPRPRPLIRPPLSPMPVPMHVPPPSQRQQMPPRPMPAHQDQRPREMSREMPLMPEQQRTMRSMYIKGDDFREITENIEIIRRRMRESEQALMRLNNLKNDQDKLFERTDSAIEDVQRKLMYVDKALFER
ncbi:MAG TPA: hypothetical protein VJC16_02295 [Candidatus Nanoarchaeia archaeon]|nr:hypothetical protein [Candidatus Nanoarchaeia archaeon]